MTQKSVTKKWQNHSMCHHGFDLIVATTFLLDYKKIIIHLQFLRIATVSLYNKKEISISVQF